MYFTPLVKQELARIIPSKDFEQKSELLAFIIMSGRIDSQGKLSIFLDNPVMVKVVYFLIKRAFQFEAKIEIASKNNKKKLYCITINDPEETLSILNQLGLAIDKRENIRRSGIIRIKKTNELNKYLCNMSVLRGAFLVICFVNDIERMYHL